MLIYIFFTITLIWAAPVMVIIAKSWWNITWWQTQNYRVTSLLEMGVKVAQQQYESQLSLSTKLLIICLSAIGLLIPENVISQLAVILMVGMWFNLAIIYFNKWQQHSQETTLSLRSLLTLNITLLLIAAMLILITNLTLALTFTTDTDTQLIDLLKSLDITQAWIFLYLSVFVLGLLDIFNFVFIGLLSWIMHPVANLLSQNSLRRAQNILEESDSQIILIAGDKGKTATTKILSQILGNDNTVAADLVSKNTIYDVAKFIRSHVTPQTKYILIELNDWMNDNFEKLDKLLSADMLIITSVDADAAVTYGSEDKLLSSKIALSNAVKQSGSLIINADNNLSLKFSQLTTKQEVFFSAKQKLAMQPENKLTVDIFTTPEFHSDNDHTSLAIQGMSNHYNIELGFDGKAIKHSILAAVTAAIKLGYNADDINTALEDLVIDQYQIDTIEVYPNIRLLISNSRPSLSSIEHDLGQLAANHVTTRLFVCEDLSLIRSYTNESYERLAQLIANHANILITYDQKLAKISTERYGIDVNLVRSAREAIASIEKNTLSDEAILFTANIDLSIVNYFVDK